MKISRYKKPLILVAIYYLVGIILIFSFPPEGSSYTPLIPIGNGFFQIALLFTIIWPLFAILGSLVIGYLLVPLFLFIHVKIYRKKMVYGIQKLEKPVKFKHSFRAFFPILLALNLGLILGANPTVIGIVLDPAFQGFFIGNVNPIAVVIILTFTIGIGIGLFSAIWFINDAGIVYSNKKSIKNNEKSHEVRSVAEFFKSLLKGYAGISVLLSYIAFIFEYVGTIDQFYYILGQSIVYIVIPFALTFSSALAMIILDLTHQKNINYTRKIAKKLGIIDIIDVSFNIKEKIVGLEE